MNLMKLLFAAVIGLTAACSHAAGFRFLEIPAEGSNREIKGAVWYPCNQASAEMMVGPYRMLVAKDCPLEAEKLPLVVISHGWGGTFLGHIDVAETLAEAGFVVVAINHGDSATDGRRNGDFSVFIDRPMDIRRTIDFMLNTWPDAGKIDVARIGMFGFSRGGYTGLVAVGAHPVFGRALTMCKDRQTPICEQASKGELPQPAHDPRIKAAVIADPLAIFFTAQSFRDVRVPIQLWASEQGGDGVTPESVAAVSRELPEKVEFHVVPNSQHFSFLPPCSEALAKRVPEICSDQRGFDRAAFHREMDAQILAFFREHLPVAK